MQVRNSHLLSDAWPPGLQPAIGLHNDGLILGDGTRLVRFTKRGCLAVEADRDRCLALLSIVCSCPVSADLIRHVEAAAAHWQRGDKVLANLRLVFAGLPKLADPSDAQRLRAAEYLLDEGMTPRELLTELGLDASALGLDKYDPDQPRVPAGSGRESGRWTDGTTAALSSNGGSAVQHDPSPVHVAASGPFHPAGINVVPVPPGDTLDPQGLNKPLSLAEQQAIADTFNSILTGRPYNILMLDPHSYKNWPSEITGAILPEPLGKYTTYRVPSGADDPDLARLLMDKGGHIFYTNNHYKSFYPVDLKATSE